MVLAWCAPLFAFIFVCVLIQTGEYNGAPDFAQITASTKIVSGPSGDVAVSSRGALFRWSNTATGDNLWVLMAWIKSPGNFQQTHKNH